MKTTVPASELADILRQTNSPSAPSPTATPSIAEHRRPFLDPDQPQILHIHWQLADFTIGEWFMRLLKLAVALALVGFMMSLPVLLFYAMVAGWLLTK